MNFKKWLEQSTVGTEFVDERQIDSAYDKGKYAVQLVQLYDKMTGQTLLTNISTIGTLQAGAYGLYNSAENKKVIGPSVVGKLKMKFGEDIFTSHKLDNIPNAVVKQYVPDIDLNQLKPSDVIHVNVAKHLAAHGDTLEALLELSSTIVHECTHELELQTFGRTSEAGPVAAEGKFMNWVKTNWQTIISRIPALKSIPSSDSALQT
jgi:hypothetical protein